MLPRVRRSELSQRQHRQRGHHLGKSLSGRRLKRLPLHGSTTTGSLSREMGAKQNWNDISPIGLKRAATMLAKRPFAVTSVGGLRNTAKRSAPDLLRFIGEARGSNEP